MPNASKLYLQFSPFDISNTNFVVSEDTIATMERVQVQYEQYTLFHNRRALEKCFLHIVPVKVVYISALQCHVYIGQLCTS